MNKKRQSEKRKTQQARHVQRLCPASFSLPFAEKNHERPSYKKEKSTSKEPCHARFMRRAKASSISDFTLGHQGGQGGVS